MSQPVPNHTKSWRGIPVKHWLMLILLCLVGYWPLSTGLFSLKNDAFVYFLPNRFAISDALHQGLAPWWNPWFYLGHPMHADLQAGVWNPVIWIFSLAGRYNLFFLHAETLLYILGGAVGIYKLTSLQSPGTTTHFVLSVAWMFSGFVLDTGQITVWTGSACFVPWVLYYSLRILRDPDAYWIWGAKGSLALYGLLTAGYPSFLMVTLYIIAAVFIFHWIRQYNSKPFPVAAFFSSAGGFLLMGTAFLLMSLPAWYSFFDFKEWVQRGSGLSLAAAQENPLHPLGVLSSLFPFSATRSSSWLHTNPTSRSLYLGIFILLALFFRPRKSWSVTDRFVLAGTIFFLLAAWGPALPLREALYHVLPGFNLFRHPGTLRLFTQLGMIWLAVPGIDALLKRNVSQKNRQIIPWFAFIAGGAAMFFAFMAYRYELRAFIQDAPGTEGWRNTLQVIMEKTGFYTGVTFDLFFQSCCLLMMAFLLNRKKPAGAIAALCLFNVMIPAQLHIPVTMVSRVSPAAMNAWIASSPKSAPLPDLSKSMGEYAHEEVLTQRQYGAACVYQKKPAWIEQQVNPSTASHIRRLDTMPGLRSILFTHGFVYAADTLLRLKDSLKATAIKKPVIFSTDRYELKNPVRYQHNLQDSIWMKELNYGLMRMGVQSSGAQLLSVFQAYHPQWKATLNGKSMEIYRGNLAFMYVKVPAGRHEIIFQYKPGYLPYCLTVALVSFLVILFILIRPIFRSAH